MGVKEMFWGLQGSMNERGAPVPPAPVSRPLNVLIELDNLLGDGQDVLGPVVSVDLRSFGGRSGLIMPGWALL